MRLAAFTITALLASTAPAFAQTGGETRIPASVETYAHAIRTNPTHDIEKLYRLGLRAADDLMADGSVDSIGQHQITNDVLEDLTEKQFDTVLNMMKGFLITREMVVFAIPDPRYFAKLARERRDEVSLDFFETMRSTCDSESVEWPAYLRQTNDYGGCTRFGSLELVRCFRLFTEYQRRHPGRYEDRIRDELGKLEEEFTTSPASCGDKNGVEREFRAFLREFPHASFAPQVQARLRALEDGSLEMIYGVSPY
jgi:hypothetical protein